MKLAGDQYNCEGKLTVSLNLINSFNPYSTDIDECVEVFGVCNQICTNVQGSYHCNCNEGFTLEPDGHTCKLNKGIHC